MNRILKALSVLLLFVTAGISEEVQKIGTYDIGFQTDLAITTKEFSFGGYQLTVGDYNISVRTQGAQLKPETVEEALEEAKLNAWRDVKGETCDLGYYLTYEYGTYDVSALITKGETSYAVFGATLNAKAQAEVVELIKNMK